MSSSPNVSIPQRVHLRRRMSKEDRKRQLLRTAIETFGGKGFSGTKTKDIAAAAGVSEAILFRHFPSKEDLYHAILDIKETPDQTKARLRDLEKLAGNRDDTALFRYVGRQVLQSFRTDPAFHRLMLFAALEGHLLASLFRQRFGLPTGDFLRKYIALRQGEGVFRKCDPRVAVTFCLSSIVQYAMSRYLFGGKDQTVPDEAVLEQLIELVLGGLHKQREKRGKGVHGNKE